MILSGIGQPTITASRPQVTAQISHAIEYSSGTGALGDARPGRDLAQPYARVVGDAQQHPGVAGQEAPVRHARTLS
jgi:hypothetical protein